MRVRPLVLAALLAVSGCGRDDQCVGPGGSYLFVPIESAGNCGEVSASVVRLGEGPEAAGWTDLESCEPLAEPYQDKCGYDIVVQCVASAPVEDGPAVTVTVRLHMVLDWAADGESGSGTYDVRRTYSNGVGDCWSLYDVRVIRQ